ncbi:LD-carboxypeptidase [Oceanobacillus kimchii]|uniref:LD-carboxypeptidase n=1 Tax=Oceanobacillus kimchii TaxID=746691 RepID=A0ABQ5TP49_9BACI|nr:MULTISPECIES: S66 peptidase family protein [Oceanobacillus]MBT2599634.1 LD-carboxypeptidase [Oceanobacillus sp. ISL-74]MCT1576824.1 LD-carboxypeptidase [Oceanobacillus kimchii]MCT2134894.1 LD-carboxypeptidase [Oceanobacillus kimchii]OEH56181.1 peptidase S66 [Oceanobacillus sp. E9]GLO67860.1 LD-carboxypeptidase [Oceanobacillus kimchii]
MLIKPPKLKAGDKVATISLSWGGAGEENLQWRYDQGVKRLEEVFGLQVIPTPNSLKGETYLHEHPEARAKDLMDAFEDPEIKAIISNIGGEDSIRLLPYIEFDVIHKNPKIFLGYSDTTISHFFCYKAGISSFYGPAIMTDFAENVEMDPYTINHIHNTLFSNNIIGDIEPPEHWTSEFLEWNIKNKDTKRTTYPNKSYEILQGEGIVQGRLIGGCIDSMESIKGTNLWPEIHHWKNSILFFETSEEEPKPELLARWLQNYATQGILQNANGIIFAKPHGETYYKEYKKVITDVLKENGLSKLPVLYNVSFGHSEPKATLPYGRMAGINCNQATFSIMESAVQD